MKAIILILFGLSVILAANPGFKARITQGGLNYANKMAMLALATSIRTLRIPDQSGKSGRVSYTISEMKITGFTAPNSAMRLISSGITWSANGAAIAMTAKFRYKYKKGWIKISDHGSLDASMTGVKFGLAVTLSDTSGKPHLSGSGCNCDIAKVRVRFHGKMSWVYNILDKYIEGKVKDLLKGKMCTLIVKAIDTDANNQLAKLPMNVVVAKKFLLDYSLNSNPAFNTKYMETFHKGEVFWKGDSKESPFSPSPLPTSSDTSRMLYLWVSEYMGNSLGYAGFQHGFLRYNLTAKDLPAANRSLLNTTCTALKCIGNLIPQIGQKYPNSKVMFRMYATSPPLIKISKGIVSMNFSGNVDLYAQTPKGQTPFLMTITSNFVANVTASIQGQLIKGKITSTNLNVDVKNSTVGKVATPLLKLMMNAAIDGFVVPTLNAQGQKGLVLPITDNIKFSRAQLSLLEGALLIATDLTYQSSVDVAQTDADENLLLHNPIPNRQRDPDMSFKVVGEKTDIFDQI